MGQSHSRPKNQASRERMPRPSEADPFSGLDFEAYGNQAAQEALPVADGPAGALHQAMQARPLGQAAVDGVVGSVADRAAAAQSMSFDPHAAVRGLATGLAAADMALFPPDALPQGAARQLSEAQARDAWANLDMRRMLEVPEQLRQAGELVVAAPALEAEFRANFPALVRAQLAEAAASAATSNRISATLVAAAPFAGPLQPLLLGASGAYKALGAISIAQKLGKLDGDGDSPHARRDAAVRQILREHCQHAEMIQLVEDNLHAVVDALGAPAGGPDPSRWDDVGPMK